MLIEDRLKDLLEYYESSRGVGHTRVLMEGLARTKDKTILLVKTLIHGESITKRNKNVMPFTWTNFNIYCRGKRDPLVIDNGAMIDIVAESITRIAQLKKEKEILEHKINTIAHIVRS